MNRFVVQEVKSYLHSWIEKFRFHDLRHTWATRLIQNGVDIYTVQRPGR
ncbi:MAG: tyrosine-type recombinase/integrase [Candidatus Brocadia sp.]